MRGRGQIAELTAIAEPDVGVIVNVGPAHLELLGSLEAIAAAKAELIAGLAPGATRDRARRRAAARAASARATCTTVTFGAGRRRVRCASAAPTAACSISAQRRGDRPAAVLPPAHHLRNLLAAVAAARALGVTPGGAAAGRRSPRCAASACELPGGVRADRRLLQRQPDVDARRDRRSRRDRPGRRVAVLGDMLELGAEAPAPSPRDRRARSRARRRAARHRRAARGRDRPRASTARRTRSPTRRRPPSCWPGCCAPATRCS